MTIDAPARGAHGGALEGAAPRRRPGWVPTVAAFATVALCLTAASWQHRRMLEKEALQHEIGTAFAAPAATFPPSAADWQPWRFRAVTLTGTFDGRHQILIDNAQHAGRVGFIVVTPLVLDDGRNVLVDRGFVVGGQTRAVLPSPPVPQGRVAVTGRIDIPSARYVELGESRLPDGPLWQHLDPHRFSQATGIDVLPIVVRALGPRGAGLAEDDALPDTGIEKHVSYMVQWLTFAAMASGLWVWFTVRPWLRARRTR